RKIFADKQNADWLPSADIVEALLRLEDAPWSEWRKGRELTAAGLARLLKPFDIKPKQHRYEDGRAGISSYEFATFADTFERYLVAPEEEATEASTEAAHTLSGQDTSIQTSTPLQPAFQRHSSDIQTSTGNEPVELTNSLQPAPHKACRGVEVRNGVNGGEGGTEPDTETKPSQQTGRAIDDHKRNDDKPPGHPDPTNGAPLSADPSGEVMIEPRGNG
ncbi:MAG TPA: DUF3631 domain-containing protein, partial [Gammaproteobacteria bacterium]|nr:DUF3631 domain-containing protein [Gammaproteobacteria bacterium]